MDEWQLDATNVLQTRDSFVAAKIREFIQQGYFAPGKKLDQNEIAELLKVSRSPVREALRTLAAEGLVKVIPHRGAVVTQLSFEELEEVFLMRAAVEGLAARLGVAKMTKVRLRAIQAILTDLNGASDFGDWLRLNTSFHHTIYQAVQKPRLFALIERLRNTATPYIRQYIASPEHLEAAQVGHSQILIACQQGDPKLAEEMTKQHIEAVWESAATFVEAGMSAALEEGID